MNIAGYIHIRQRARNVSVELSVARYLASFALLIQKHEIQQHEKFHSVLNLHLIFKYLFAQKVERNPEKIVKAHNKSEVLKEKELKELELVVDEGVRRTEIHADGSKTIVITFTEIAPSAFNKTESEKLRVPLSSLNWLKDDLLLYIKSLDYKRSAVSKRPDAHALALQNGWYEFMDSIYLEARELYNTLKQ